MALKKIRLGDYIELCEEKNSDGQLKVANVRGISTQKRFIETKANMDGVSITGYRIVRPDCFAYVPDTSRRGEQVSLAYNDSETSYLVSSISVVFRVSNEALSSLYLFLYFNRPEFDRYARFNSFGSAREPFNWEDMCDIEIELPDRITQDRFVDAYLSLLKNQQTYERGLDDLKLVCDGFIESLRRKCPPTPIGGHIKLLEETNENKKLGLENVRGITTQKTFIPTKANMMGVSLRGYKMVPPHSFAYVADTSRRGDKVSLAYNSSEETFLVSSITTVFEVIDTKTVSPDYLNLLLSRPEFDRYARFCSWGSAREVFPWEEMCNVRLPLPNIEVQRSIANVFKVYNERKRINEQLKKQLQTICPVLIKGSIDEARRS